MRESHSFQPMRIVIGIVISLVLIGCNRQEPAGKGSSTTSAATRSVPSDRKMATNGTQTPVQSRSTPPLAIKSQPEKSANESAHAMSDITEVLKPTSKNPPTRTDSPPKEVTPAAPFVKKPRPSGKPNQFPLLQKHDFKYVGAFRLPGANWGEHTFAYGGTAFAFNPENHSLFLVGHDHHQEIAEVSIPEKLINSDKVGELPTGSFLQPFTKVLNRVPKWTLKNTVKIGGLIVADKKLIGTGYVYYDGPGEAVDSHFVLDSTKLSSPVAGLFQVGKLGAGFVAGYMAAIPDEWRASFGKPYLTGQAALAIISRTSSGPAVFGFDPAKLGNADLVENYVYYPLKHAPTKMDTANPFYNGMTSIRGVAFPSDTRSVLFFGTHNDGAPAYKPGGWVLEKGRQSAQVWAYDANKLVAVKGGSFDPWKVQPYATWELKIPTVSKDVMIGGAAFDAQSGQLYVSQQFADGVMPLIHVFTVDN